VALANWAAPCLIRQEQQDAQCQIIGFVCMEKEANLAVCLNPVFCYRKGSLWLTEHAMLKALVTQGVAVDKTWCLLFDKKVAAVSGVSQHCVRWSWWSLRCWCSDW